MVKFFLANLSEDNSRELLGSDNQIIFSDLKTLRGVLNRIKKYNLNYNKSFRIYQFYGHLFDNNIRLVYEYIK